MKKKVGIVTFHFARNYGATLQAFALQKKLLETCDVVDIIDYRNSKILKELKLWCPKGKGIKDVIRTMGAFFFRARKKIAFDSFTKKRMALTPRISKEKLKDYVKKYDVLITGSDQVWNGNLTDGDMTYYLDMASPNQKLVSYAASFGDAELLLDPIQDELLQRMDCISLRESNMKSTIEEATGKSVEICCDPTLLLKKKEWLELVPTRLMKKPYLFLFMIEESPHLIECAKKIAKEKNLTIVSNKNCVSFIKHPSPDEFLAWVFNAEYVLTNSFHGTVFSILFEKQFLSHVISNDGSKKKRILELLKMANLEHRTINGLDQLDSIEDWDLVRKKMDDNRKLSYNYLKESIL